MNGAHGVLGPGTKKFAPRHVLVVDDEPLIRWSLAETLADAGYDVTEAADGEKAIQALANNGPGVDVVLLDFRLPDSSDLTLLRAIRCASPASPVVLMTAFGTPEMMQEARTLGAFDVITKPLDMNDMPALVERAYESRPS